MLDFVSVKAVSFKRGVTEIYPEFLVKKSNDLMIRGRAFYAIWDEAKGLWSQSEDDARRLIDDMVFRFAKKYETEDSKVLKLLSNFSSNQWLMFQKYCKSLPDNYHELDTRITFANTEVTKKDYVSRKLGYSLADGNRDAYDELIGTLYEPEEREKIEWAIGAVISGDSKKLQKFVVLYGDPGSGKSTILNVIEKLFDGYCASFDSKTLASANNAFALEALRSNPLLAIQHEGDLSRIEDNTKLNSIVSHEAMVMNEKFKSTYSTRLNTFLIMATNKPVRITDAKSGIIRRLIDVTPSGKKIPFRRYVELNRRIDFEIGAIAYHCLQVYKDLGMNYYDKYVPLAMMGETNVFYNFVEDNYDFFVIDHPDQVSLNMAWARYKEYCSEANISYPYQKYVFKAELKNYFRYFDERWKQERNVYREFLKEKLEHKPMEKKETVKDLGWLELKETKSLFDDIFADCPAQYAGVNEKPTSKWSNVKTKLCDLDTKRLHYIKVPKNVIVIDFDLKDENGNKDRDKNIEAANKWPPTYAEFSKSGSGIHLHYYYEGDAEDLSRIFDENIEVKISIGDSSLRRQLSYCNDIPIATISSGLPLKGGKKVLNEDQIESEGHLRSLIKKAIRKEVNGHTKTEIDFIHYILEKAYNSGMKYDVTDLRPSVQALALGSTNQVEYCLKAINKMRFRSEEPSENIEAYGDGPLVFFDVEVLPNLFVVVWMKDGEKTTPVKMINPTPGEIQELVKFKLVGFNNRRYDNHILYARIMGYTEAQLYRLSNTIVNGTGQEARDALFREAYNLSYTDIYDLMNASNKMSLKKWEIKLGIHHQELGIPWDQPVPEYRWQEVANYCVADVIATKALWHSPDVQADWTARQILADLSGLTVNDTTNQHTTKIIVGNDRNPQSQYVYTDLSTIYPGYRFDKFGIKKEDYIPGTKIVSGKSIYKGLDPGEGGYVYAEPGIYYRTAVLDIASMHPHSAIRLKIFGETYTMRFAEIVQARIYIKHKDYEKAKHILDGKLAKYLDDPSQAKKLANALKTAINSVYGLTSAKFDNKLRDPRNKDNIVAKYGALFMINLKEEVQKKGYTVVHIKTDSIKIANANNDIIQFVMDYGKQYGYTFEHESTYQKICLVNDSVYIARYEDSEVCQKLYGYIPEKNQDSSLKWTATGAQFQIPYVFKTLFSKEPIEFIDLCETKSVSTAMYLDMNEGFDPDSDEHSYHFVGKVGQFCPIKPGYGGGVLLRQGEDGKFSAATGTKKRGSNDVYRWLESETVKLLHMEDLIDRSYYNSMIDDAIETISKYGDFEQFVDPTATGYPDWMNVPEVENEEIPF